MTEKIASVRTDIENDTFLFELFTSDQSDLPVYIAGNFNNWNVNDGAWKLEKNADGKYRLKVKSRASLPYPLEYKYTRGSWTNAEVDEYGNELKNRRVEFDQNIARDFVPRWKRDGLSYNFMFLPEIQIISEHFEIPQLIKTRRISALLPYDYYLSNRRYPVLYLQDGQNLFDDYAPFGNWAVDKKLAVLAEKGMGEIIIIAIDHAEEERINEFTPSISTRLGKGDGKKYVRFLADTLKPYVDKHFRTLPESNFTGIGGSSMGGLITIYAGFMYPEVYGKLMVFSPSLWVAPNIHFQLMQLDEALNLKIYLYGGNQEGTYMVPNMQRFIRALEQQGIASNIDFHLSIDPQGKHNEARWGEEFPKAVEWLFFKNGSQKT
ncbi:MAG: alpha/beta hydrolase-fold protein [Saprospiraceae bacterium]|nr:alpha/beta hydrolase-fold protein [Saprospiraceae bacterium]